MDLYRKLFDLSAKTAVVIGGASGIGEASAYALAAFGAEVIVADVITDGAARVAETISEGGGRARGATVDLGDEVSVNALVDGLERLDVLVSTPSVNVRKPLLEITSEEFERIVSLNLKGTFFALKAAGRRMAAQESGSLIAFASIRATTVEPGQGVYAATKAGTLQLIRALAAELGPKGVRANAIAPGAVETPLTEPIKSHPEWYRAYAEKSALRRWGKPHEIAGAVVYLASDAASFVTGSLFFVDGGWTAIDGRFTPPL